MRLERWWRRYFGVTKRHKRKDSMSTDAAYDEAEEKANKA
jgi:hypothetical protein